MRSFLVVVCLLLAVPANAQTYPTLNPSDKTSSISLSGGNLVATGSGASVWCYARGTTSKSTGKHYFEVTITNGDNQHNDIGLLGPGTPSSNDPGVATTGWVYYGWGTGYKGHANSYVGGLGVGTSGTVIGIAWDASTGGMWIRRNGTWTSGDPSAGTSPSFTGITGEMFPVVASYGGGVLTANFGASAFAHSVPSGFTAGWIDAPSDPVEPIPFVVGLVGAHVSVLAMLGVYMCFFFVGVLAAGAFIEGWNS